MGAEEPCAASNEIAHVIETSMLLIKKKRRMHSSAFALG
ncbi:hypothetical protein SynMITS9220_00138 [Synechococcus sp. MIT S9220]|nr:hypothetical protein SynMITS9220_00138 [Synechococcus sp. MIT S9220]